ncbi:MAG TPA: hypothetical protein VNQ81_08570, partial [Povalibacter sp.]|nr:hypothetical protein [Povalibacter sp.]
MSFSNVDCRPANTRPTEATGSRLSPTLASAVALLIAAASTSAPQTTHAQEAAEGQATQRTTVEQVVVTGSRIGRADGFEAPTPVTVLGDAELRTFASPN